MPVCHIVKYTVYVKLAILLEKRSVTVEKIMLWNTMPSCRYFKEYMCLFDITQNSFVYVQHCQQASPLRKTDGHGKITG